jgi:MFS family permease
MGTTLPLYARVAAIAGRPVVLLAALAMSAPGEYRLAVMAGWAVSVAWLMPVCLSVYAAVAAVIAATRPKGVTGRASALVGAAMALALALAAQVTAHLIASGYMSTSAFLVAATSAVPPVVVAHLLHLAAVPREDADSVPGVAADSFPSADLWQDFEESAPDSVEDAPDSVEDTAPVMLPQPADIRAAIDVLATVKGRPVTGAMLGEHFGVSERTGRRYLSMAA